MLPESRLCCCTGLPRQLIELLQAGLQLGYGEAAGGHAGPLIFVWEVEGSEGREEKEKRRRREGRKEKWEGHFGWVFFD